MNCESYRGVKLSKMRISLCMLYWSLLLTSLISSCLLFLIVASETVRLEKIDASETLGRLLHDPKQPAAAAAPSAAVEAEEPPQRLPENAQAVSSAASDFNRKELKKVPKSGFSDSAQDVVEEPPVDEVRIGDERFVEIDSQQMNKRIIQRIQNIPLRCQLSMQALLDLEKNGRSAKQKK